MSARLLIITISLAASCTTQPQPEVNEEDIVARVQDYILYKSEVDAALEGAFDIADSAETYQNYIRKWVRNQTMIERANVLLSDSAKDKSKLMKQYYNDLLIYELQILLIQERLDTVVEEAAIKDYYDNNIRNFELKENIVRLHFMKFPANTKELDELWQMFASDDAEQLNELREICTDDGGTVMSNDTTWFVFNDILKEVPILTYNQEVYLDNHKFIRLVDRGWVYFVNIRDFRVKNKVSPFEFQAPRIKNIIINKRKVELMQQIEEEIVKEAYDKQLIEIY